MGTPKLWFAQDAPPVRAVASPGLRRIGCSTRNSPSSSQERDALASSWSVHVYDPENRIMKKLGYLLVLVPLCIGYCATNAFAADAAFNGLDLNLGNLYRVSKAQSRSISPENFTGEKGKAGMATEGTGKGAARDLGNGWKISPSVRIKAKTTFTMGEIKGPGCIQQIWMTPTGNWRHSRSEEHTSEL